MDTGEVGCEWRDGESLRTSYLFVSRKRDVIVKRITSTSPDLEMTFGMDIHYNTIGLWTEPDPETLEQE